MPDLLDALFSIHDGVKFPSIVALGWPLLDVPLEGSCSRLRCRRSHRASGNCNDWCIPFLRPFPRWPPRLHALHGPPGCHCFCRWCRSRRGLHCFEGQCVHYIIGLSLNGNRIYKVGMHISSCGRGLTHRPAHAGYVLWISAHLPIWRLHVSIAFCPNKLHTFNSFPHILYVAHTAVELYNLAHVLWISAHFHQAGTIAHFVRRAGTNPSPLAYTFRWAGALGMHIWLSWWGFYSGNSIHTFLSMHTLTSDT